MVSQKTKQELDNQRRLRLIEFFKNNKIEWEDLKEEMLICLNNAINTLKSSGCDKREFYAGKCQGIEEVVKIEDMFIK